MTIHSFQEWCTNFKGDVQLKNVIRELLSDPIFPWNSSNRNMRTYVALSNDVVLRRSLDQLLAHYDAETCYDVVYVGGPLDGHSVRMCMGDTLPHDVVVGRLARWAADATANSDMVHAYHLVADRYVYVSAIVSTTT